MNTEQFVPAANTAERALEQIKGKAKDTEKEITNLERKVSQTQQRLAASFTGMVANVGSLAFAFRDLGDSQVQIDTLELKMRKLRASMNDASLSADKLAIKNEELRILGERHTDAVENQEKAYWQFGLSMVTMATTSIPATIAAVTQMRAAQAQLAVAHLATAGAATTQTAANVGLTLSFHGLTKAMMSNPLGLALVAGSTAALAIYSTNLFGVKDRVDSLIGSFSGGTQEMQQFHSEIKTDGISTMQQYTSEIRNLGSEYERTIGVLKKNDIRSELGKIQGEMSTSLLFMGSLTSIMKELEAAGVQGVAREFQKDLRGIKKELTSLGVDDVVGFRDAVSDLESSFSSMGLSTTEQHIFRTVSGRITDVFRYLRAAGVSSLSRTLHGNLSQYGGLGRDYTEKIISQYQMSTRYRPTNPDGSIGLRSLSLSGRIGTGNISKGKSSKHGGNKPRLTLEQEFAAALGLQLGSADKGNASFFTNRTNQAYSSTVQFLTDEGVGVPSPYLDARTALNLYGRGTGLVANPNFASQLAAANAEATRRRNERIAPYRGLGYSDSSILNMLQDLQGKEDLSGMKLAKQLASLA